VHYALRWELPGTDTLADAYQQDPKTDFHGIVAEMAKIPRSQAKTINLGLFYGMGKMKLQKELDLSPQEARELFYEYHSKVLSLKNFQMD